MINAPELSRTNPDRLRLEGMICTHCSSTMFPVRMVCPYCGKRTPILPVQKIVQEHISPPVAEHESFLFATVARRVNQDSGND